MDDLIAAIADVREKLGQRLFSSEDQVSKGVVMRLLQTLGWDVFDPARVSSEFRIGSRRVDYALQRHPFGPIALIEVKDVGKATAKGEDQLFDYCAKQGVPLAILTDGGTWSFCLPAGMGNYEQRRFAVVNLVSDEGSRCAKILRRYLGFDAVVSGQSHRDAQSDYEIYRQRIVAREQFAPVLQSLIAEADPRVVVLFSDEVEKRCGIRPEEGEIRGFLRSHAGPWTTAKRVRERPGRSAQPQPSPPNVQPVRRPVHSSQNSFTLDGQTRTFGTADECFVAVFKALARRDARFCERYSSRHRGRNLVWLARTRGELYTDPDLIEKRTAPLPGGWYVGTNIGNEDKIRRIRLACEISRLEYGRDLVVHLRSGK